MGFRMTVAGALSVLTLGCGPTLLTADDSATESSDTSADGSTDSDTDSSTESDTDDESSTDGEPQAVCGNGVVEPGEACEPNPSVCDECSSDCEVAPLVDNEWAVPTDPIVEWPVKPPMALLWVFPRIKLGLDGSVVIRGHAIDGEVRVLGVTPDGVVTHAFGETEHGFSTMLDHAVGPSGEIAMVGIADGISQVRLVDSQAVFAPAWPVPDGSDQVAVTEHGIATLSPGSPVRSFAFDGMPTWDSVEAWDRLVGVDGRLLMAHIEQDFGTIEGAFEFIAGDGTDALTWESQTQTIRAIASTAPVGLGGSLAEWNTTADAVATGFDLWTGEEGEWVLATDPGDPYPAPGVLPLDARPNGLPVARWHVCYGSLDQFGCAGTIISGVGHPDDPDAVVTHGCDDIGSLRVGPDDGVYLLTRQLDQSWMLVRRQTLE